MSNKTLMAKLARLERLASPSKPKIDPALAAWCREELARRMNNAYEYSQEYGDELMLKIQARVSQMRAESSCYD